MREQVQQINGTYHFGPPKTKSGVRTIPLPPFIAKAILQHKERQAVEMALAGEEWDDSWGVVFPTTFGKPQDQRWVRRQFRAVLAKANLPLIRFHDQRSLAISMLVATGLNPRVIMQIVGHKTLHQTMVIYAKVLSGEEKAVANAIQNMMGDV